MTLIAAEHISQRYNKQVLLDDVSFTVGDKDRIALVGKNGIGKTTLLEMLAGKQTPGEGTINRSKQCKIDYVEQEKSDYLDLTLFEFVAESRADLLELRRKIQQLEHHLAEQPSDQDTLEKLGELQLLFEQQGGFNFENEIGTILVGLGFERSRYQDRLANFSGGEKNRAGLARILAGRGNLLLLDEPTNHLDIESTTWLEEYLRSLEKAYLIVSHDRAFLNATVDRVWELNFGKIDSYVGNIDFYLRERQERRRLAAHYYRHQQEEIARIQDFIQRNMAGQKTKQAQSKQKLLAKIKRLPPPKTDASGPAIKIESSGRSWAHVLSVAELATGYATQPVLTDVSFDLYRGDRIGIIGRNGSGKSTLLKTIIGDLAPIEGSARVGNNVDVAYFDQELSDLNLNATVLDNIWELDPGAEAGKIRSFLARFGFTGEDVFKATPALSGGEKTKLCLARLLYHPANLIILDEPTNHLDMQAREALETALLEYDGTCIVVSHDRYFLNRVAQRIAHVRNGGCAIYDGNYDDFKERMLQSVVTVTETSTESKQAYEAFKEESRRKGRHKKELRATREAIEAAEARLVEIERDLAHVKPDDWEQLQSLQQAKHDTENSILELYEKLEGLEAESDD